MSGDDYQSAIEALGLNQMAAGRWLKVCPRTAQHYAKRGPPEPVAMLLRLMLTLDLDPADVK